MASNSLEQLNLVLPELAGAQLELFELYEKKYPVIKDRHYLASQLMLAIDCELAEIAQAVTPVERQGEWIDVVFFALEGVLAFSATFPRLGFNDCLNFNQKKLAAYKSFDWKHWKKPTGKLDYAALSQFFCATIVGAYISYHDAGGFDFRKDYLKKHAENVDRQVRGY